MIGTFRAVHLEKKDNGTTGLVAQYFSINRNTTKDTKRTSTILLLYMVAMLAVSTMFASAQAYTVQDIYIDNRNYPGGPWAWFLNSQEKTHNVMFFASNVRNNSHSG